MSIAGKIALRNSITALAAMSVVCVMAGCFGENEKLIRHKLELICEDDMASMTEEVPADERLDPVYYTITVFKKYDEGKYSYMAVVDFYFFKKVKLKAVRKYRYHSTPRQWERYFNEYKIIHDE
jgi:hypothetical protein